MAKPLAAAAAVAIVLPLALLLLATATPPASQAATSLAGGPSILALDTIPPAYLASTWPPRACPGLPWTIPAAIGKAKSDHGQSAAPGVHSGANHAGAEGPMEFRPATFAQYAVNADPAAR